MPRAADQSGFSLIETLVALAIGALVMATAMSSLSTSLGRTARAEDMIAAQRLARAKLEAWSFIEPEQTGTGAEAGFRWRIEAEPYDLTPGEEAPDGGRLLEITITVEWDDPSSRRSLALTSFRREAGS